MGGKIFAVLVIVIAIASAVPIINHTFLGASVKPPEDISTHGAEPKPRKAPPSRRSFSNWQPFARR